MSTLHHSKTLIVPVGVDAMCLGNSDAHASSKQLAPPHVDFTVMSYREGQAIHNKSSANLSESVVKKPFAGRTQLPPGVYIQWALPDALTQGKTDGKAATQFPSVPNRWLLTRKISDAAGSLQQQSWVIVSDLLSTGDPSMDSSIAYRCASSDNLEDFRPYQMGKAFDASAWPHIPPADATLYDKLTAVGYGEESFSAYFPDSGSAFGFFDDFKGISLSTTSIQVSYTVTGWHANPQEDPLRQQKALEDLKWFVDGGEPLPPADTTLYSGTIQGISWNPDDHYLPTGEDLDLDVVIANNPPEALSALLASKLSTAKDPNIEFYLNALQQSLLQELGKTDSLTDILESLHRGEFGFSPGGSMWLVKQAATTDSDKTGTPPENIEITLSDSVAEDLNQLNIIQEAIDTLQEKIHSQRWQVFSDWYKYMVIEYQENVNHTHYPNVNDTRDYITKEIKSLNQSLDKLKPSSPDSLTQKRDALVKKIGGELPKNQSLEATPSDHYWHANDPVLMLHGAGMQPSQRFGRDGKYTSEGTLECRHASQLMQCVDVEGVAVETSALPALAIPTDLPFAQELDAIFRESLLLDPHCDALLSKCIDAKKTKEAIRKTLEQSSSDTLSGKMPSPLAVTPWNKEAPFQPIIMEWEVEFYPIEYLTDTADYSADFIEKNFTLNANRIDYDYTGTPPSQPEIYEGSVVLSPHAASDLKNQLNNFIKHNAKDSLVPELKDVLKVMDALPVLSQAMSGFNQSLLMQEQTLQFPVSDALASSQGLADFTNITVRNAVSDENNVAPQPEVRFNALRAGFTKISQLRLVDSFGRTRKVDLSNVIVAESLKTAAASDQQAYFPPRIVQPSRLLFRWLSADHDTVETNKHPAASPITGWIVPNHLDNSLMFYDEKGEAVGSLVLVDNDTQVVWQSAPGNPIQSLSEAFSGKNKHLLDFATNIENRYTFIKELIETVDRTQVMINPSNAGQHRSLAVLMGKPIALVRASLRYQLQGDPAYDQSWDLFNNQVEKKAPRSDHQFTQIKIPIELGDLAKMNDGLIGYFKESGDQADYTHCYAPAAKPSYTQVVPPPKHNLEVTSDAQSDPVTLTLLVDPRAGVHATSGVLPVEEAAIPPDQFAPALKKIAVTFLAAPILGKADAVVLPLPNEAGYDWSWEAMNAKQSWSSQTDLGKANAKATFAYDAAEISEGWLKLFEAKQKD